MESKIQKRKQEKLAIEDCKCTICFNFIIEPVQLECKHYFCFDCAKTLLNLKIIRCPVCRKEIKINSLDLEISLEIENKIENSFPELYITELEKLKKIKELQKTKKNIFFKIGNEHKLKEEVNSTSNKHDWTLYIKLEENFNPLIFIKKIRYKLHPSFGITERELKNPFRDSYVGWGTFSIPFVIEFK